MTRSLSAKIFEKDGTCKYCSHCTFAHGDADLRSKADNYTNIQPNVNMMEPNMMYNYQMMQQMGMMPPNFDMNQMAMAGNFDPNQMMMNMDPQMGMDMMMPQGQNQQGNNNEAK